VTFMPRERRRQPREAAITPFPRPERTPPVTNTNFPNTYILPIFVAWPTLDFACDHPFGIIALGA